MKSLVATPSVLTMMSTKLDWTQKLGDAVLAQQPDVMDAVQRLRTKAQANNKLQSTKEQKVTSSRNRASRLSLSSPQFPIQSMSPTTIRALSTVGGRIRAYPPYYFPPPSGYVPGAFMGPGLRSAPACPRPLGVRRKLLGWRCELGNNNINVNRNTNINNIGGGNNWQHNPEHRQGVRYSNTGVQQKFGNNNVRAEVRTGWISAAAAATRFSSLVVASQPWRSWWRRQSPGRGSGGAERPGRRRGQRQRPNAQAVAAVLPIAQAAAAGRGPPGPEAAEMPSGIFSPAERPAAQSARGHASVRWRRWWRRRAGGGGGGARAGGGGGGARGGGGGGGRAAVAVVADGDPTSRSSTISSFSAS